MMNEQIEKLYNVISLATTFAIDDLIIETSNGQSTIRGINNEQSVVILTKAELQLPDNTVLAISPTQQLKECFNVFDQFVIEYDVENEIIRRINIKSKKSTITFNGSNPVTIKAPKRLKDEHLTTIKIDKKLSKLIEKGFRAIANKQSQKPTIDIVSNGNKMTIKIANFRQDVIEFEECFDNNVKETFLFKYPAEYFLKSISHNEINESIEIGKKGTAKFTYKDSLDYYLIPKV